MATSRSCRLSNIARQKLSRLGSDAVLVGLPADSKQSECVADVIDVVLLPSLSPGEVEGECSSAVLLASLRKPL
jgi:hypothetical protein